MTCQELCLCLGAHLDGELDVERGLAANEHLAFCMPCQWAYAQERELRTLVRTGLRRDRAPAGLAERIRVALREAEGERVRPVARRWLRWTLPVAAVLLLAAGIGLWGTPAPAPVVSELVTKHIVYSRLEAPAEIVSTSQEAVSGWFRGRVRFEVPVPDFTPSGIHLVGARLSDLSDRQVAYLLYEKGRSLVSLFAFPRKGLVLPTQGWVRAGDAEFYVSELRGTEVVLWTQGELAYALVSSLDRASLLECAETVWRLVVSRRAPGA
jgi:anti-sigma factor RsiW